MRVKQPEYVLGHADREQLRLIRQTRMLAPFTERHLREAGISSGMRVCIGCGMGDVTMLAAGFVGPTRSVVSIDIEQASVETARKRALSVQSDLKTRHSIEQICKTLRTRNPSMPL